ncbi:uncharacterized protein FIBRA_03984 [Fibroporia radiculosa]|uniref:G domain-containing protein n=1 Tax=Fibroporia radiculosa TaxID=599839 RepID=J4G6P1_9APHY|nr:uncharacterized protein FIBRA_03984 [Fibroporia radiculosa]CCM01913.1 predicted protein [Fibroporia radiculosa]
MKHQLENEKQKAGQIKTKGIPKGGKKIFIAVMGPTGAGKTSFINLVSGSKLRIGAGLQSTTDRIQLSRPFQLGQDTITLIDTPGFDDTSKSDVDILTLIANYLELTFKKKQVLTGVIYLHRITDNRMGGIALRNWKMFSHLCGRAALANAAIVLNMWNQVSEVVGNARKTELVSKDIFFKPAIDAGAKVFTHNNTLDSAREILRDLAGKDPKPLSIQIELITERKPVRQTAAGVALLGDLAEKERKHQEQIQELRKGIAEAIRQKDEEDRKDLEEARKRLEDAITRLAAQQQSLKTARPQKNANIKLQQKRRWGCLSCMSAKQLE